MFRFLLLLLSLSFMPGAQADDRALANELHTIRSLAFTTCSNLLLYHSSGGYGGDSRNLDAYRAGMARLSELVARSGDVELQEPVRQMREQVGMLERNENANRLLKPRWVIPALQAQALLDARLADRYAALSVPPAMRMLHEQSLDISRILLMYQIRAFGSLAVYFMEVDEDTPKRLDLRVIDHFGQLMMQLPDKERELDELQRHYLFIRPRLLGRDAGSVPAGVEYYLGKTVVALDGMATL
ncbi:hypothetical protein M8R19_21670 [Pseudomonas sp. R3.Fl]|uniref:hypothetical protein n=1 Tax=Pseudomonas sp. R3.Fl TaxID=2928708 RepID=UPI00201E1F67|nr:hypothetical protein [Pseudomonas sp. R3.Fl]MCL6691311.1 hypothetical protein [Pseudomonas sp. R3.Fl]